MDKNFAEREYQRITDDLGTLPKEIVDIELTLVERRRMKRDLQKKIEDFKSVLAGMEMRYQLAVIKVPEKMNADEKKAWIRVKMLDDADAQVLVRKISDAEEAINQYEYQIEKGEAEKSELSMRNNNAGFSARAFLARAMVEASFAEMPVVRTNGHVVEDMPL